VFKPKRISRKRGAIDGPTVRLFHGVAVKAPGGHACAAVVRIEGQRFLADEAPQLPLEGCSHVDRCRCVYVHFQDRRTGSRREADDGLPQRPHDPDRRNGVGRRVTDGFGAGAGGVV
jgi:hypothetical protein